MDLTSTFPGLTYATPRLPAIVVSLNLVPEFALADWFRNPNVPFKIRAAPAIVRSSLVDPANVWMISRRNGDRLLLEPGVMLSLQPVHSDDVTEARILRLPPFGYAARANRRKQRVRHRRNPRGPNGHGLLILPETAGRGGNMRSGSP